MQAPQIWNYHPATLALLRTSEPCFADADPEVPENWLYPGCTTTVEPGPDINGKLQTFDLASESWVYKDLPSGTPAETPAVGDSSPEELVASVQTKRDQLLQIAALRIAPLADAKDLGEATPDEDAALTAWKQYRVALNRVTKQETYPQTVVWPDPPEA
ncbi:MAG: hypothetical protein GAK35_03550 [Herbaspirillum frisingense]|uniref:Tail fiber assembly protein n=1 Tax=Herbaspirillum frisingense TaxID=92645 RepID=A0A7V8FU35_9BURK|nr:MAG: hypothetical protein GAK35_03550 [Herbaspirillum frisingense]